MRWVMHVGRMIEMRNMYNILVEKSAGENTTRKT
jgi:hypothetical protein